MRVKHRSDIGKRKDKILSWALALLFVFTTAVIAPSNTYAAYTGGAVGENTGVTSSTANDWQIVSGEYNGCAAANKTRDDLVRVQKNIVPTGVENEFLVYESIDKKMDWETLLSTSNLWLTTSGSLKEKDLGATGTDVKNLIKGNPAPVGKTVSGKNDYNVTVNIRNNASSPILMTYQDVWHGDTSNCSNGTGALELKKPDGTSIYVAVAMRVNLGAGNGHPLTFDILLDTLQGLDVSLEKVTLDKVTTTLPPGAEIIEVLPNSTQNAAVYSDGTMNPGSLVWNITEQSKMGTLETENGHNSGWFSNVAQCVYKIRLNTTSEDFNPCGNAASATTLPDSVYDIGETTELSWSAKHLGTGATRSKTTLFNEPEVKGVLYSIDINKVDPSGNKLNGAQFQMTGNLLRNNESYTSPVEKSDAGKTPMVRFTDIRTGGSYTLTEIKAPTGYYVSPDSWTMAMNYTNTKTDYTYNAATNTMQYTKLGNPFTITNQKAYGKLTISKTVVGSTTDQAQDFTFTFRLYDDDYTPAQEITESYSYIGSKSGTIKSGDTITLKHGQSITINNLPASARYVVTETANSKFDTTSTGDTGLIEKDKTKTAAFTNTRAKGNLTISKTVEPGLDTQNTEEFEFNLTLTDYDAPLTGTYQYTGSKSGTIGNGGTVKLKNGQSITIKGLPAGAKYKVIESPSEKYDLKSATGDEGTVPKNATATAAFVNEPKKEAKLYIKKVIDGNDTANLANDEFIINAKGGDVDAAAVLKDNETSDPILFKKDTTVSISEIIPMEYSLERLGVITKGSTTETPLSGSTYDLKLGDEVTIVVHNSYEWKPYFHDFDSVMNKFKQQIM